MTCWVRKGKGSCCPEIDGGGKESREGEGGKTCPLELCARLSIVASVAVGVSWCWCKVFCQCCVSVSMVSFMFLSLVLVLPSLV